MSKKIEPRIKTYTNQQEQTRKLVAGNGVSFVYDNDNNLILNANGGGSADIDVIQIVPDDNMQVLYADGLATFSGLTANITDNDSVPAELELPIIAGAGIVIDASDDQKSLIVKANGGVMVTDVTINQPSGATNGTLSDAQLATLLASSVNRIVFDNEIYYCNDYQHEAGFLVYTHSGHDSMDKFFIKCITVTVSTGGWVLNTKELA